jgi:hypothetical protein
MYQGTFEQFEEYKHFIVQCVDFVAAQSSNAADSEENI